MLPLLLVSLGFGVLASRKLYEAGVKSLRPAHVNAAFPEYALHSGLGSRKLHEEGAKSLRVHHMGATVPAYVLQSDLARYFGNPYASLTPISPEEVCEAGRCYRETGRELWIEPLRSAAYRAYGCSWGICNYRVVAGYYHRAILLPGPSQVPANSIASSEACYSLDDAARTGTAYLFAAQYSVLTLHVSYRVTEGGLVSNETEVFAVKLPQGNCDIVYAYAPMYANGAMVYAWFRSLTK